MSRPRGPVERSLDPAVREAATPVVTGATGGLSVAAAPRDVIGEFMVDLRGCGAGAGAGARRLAEALAARHEVSRAVAVPPKVYLSVVPPFLHDAVVDAVLAQRDAYGSVDDGRGLSCIVDFSGPNANKPLHLGHLRNNLLGMAIARMAAAAGYTVERHAVHSDWGIHVCQALVGWRRWGGGATPAEAGVKGDHFVGRLYARFHAENASARARLDGDRSPTDLDREAAGLLRAMAAGDRDLAALNERVVGWADRGIKETYGRIGTTLHRVFFESEHVTTGRALVDDGLALGVLGRRPDGSAFFTPSGAEGGEVTVQRSDGTPLVFAQWAGVNVRRFAEPVDRAMILTGREWETGFATLMDLHRRLGHAWADDVEAVHFGMVRLPEGRMRSREGLAVSTDALLDRTTARLLDGWGEPDRVKRRTCEALGLAVVKHHLLGVPRLRDLAFDEDAMWQQSLPRIAALVGITREARRRAGAARDGDGDGAAAGAEPVRRLLLHLNAFPAAAAAAFERLDPSVLVRHLDGTVDRVAHAAPVLAPCSPVWEAAGAVVACCLARLNVSLPPDPASLPPAVDRALERQVPSLADRR